MFSASCTKLHAWHIPSPPSVHPGTTGPKNEVFAANTVSGINDSAIAKNLTSLVYYLCGRCRNRTHTNGFGDRCSTTKLSAHRKLKSPRRGHYALFLNLFKGHALSELLVVLFELKLYVCELFLILTRIENGSGGGLKFYEVILRHDGEYTRK